MHLHVRISLILYGFLSIEYYLFSNIKEINLWVFEHRIYLLPKVKEISSFWKERTFFPFLLSFNLPTSSIMTVLSLLSVIA